MTEEQRQILDEIEAAIERGEHIVVEKLLRTLRQDPGYFYDGAEGLSWGEDPGAV